MDFFVSKDKYKNPHDDPEYHFRLDIDFNNIMTRLKISFHYLKSISISSNDFIDSHYYDKCIYKFTRLTFSKEKQLFGLPDYEELEYIDFYYNTDNIYCEKYKNYVKHFDKDTKTLHKMYYVNEKNQIHTTIPDKPALFTFYKNEMSRAAGKMFEAMLVGAGASISSMASSEVYQGLQAGVLTGVNTSSESFVSFKLFEQVKCITPPGKFALWFMYQPVIMSKKSFDKLNDKQKEALLAAGKKAEAYMTKEAANLDTNMEKVFKEKGVQVVQMTEADFKAWIQIAKATSYKKFSEKVKDGDKLIAKALAVK
jgi:hypothetical protein